MSLDALISPACRLRLAAFEQLWVGFSGGLDSTVLLHALHTDPTLRPKLHAMHVHHGLSQQADDWQQHCAQVCRDWSIPFRTEQVTLSRSTNIEAQARAARLQVFAPLITHNVCLILAHHQHDQAETVLLQLCRGAGVVGLAAMPEWLAFQGGLIARPLLHRSKQAVLAYANTHQLCWVDDESNRDVSYARNYLRHRVLPILQNRWPQVTKRLALAAEHMQQAQSNLIDLAYLDCPNLATIGQPLLLTSLQHLPMARLSNVVRVWLTNQVTIMPSYKTFQRLLLEVIPAQRDRSPSVAWAGFCVRRYRQALYLLTEHSAPAMMPTDWLAFPAPLKVQAHFLQAQVAEQGLLVSEQTRVQVRFRQGGETLVWQGKTRRLKQLLQEWGVPPWQRGQIPLVYIDGVLAAVVDFCISDPYYSSQSARVFHISALPAGVVA